MKILYSISKEKEYPYPRLDGLPIEGLDADFVVLERVDVARPVYDPLLQELKVSWVADLAAGTYSPEYELRDQPAERVYPDWNGLYLDFRDSEVYLQLVSLELQYSNISAALTKVIAAVTYGIIQGSTSVEMEILCKAGLQSSFNLLFHELSMLSIDLGDNSLLSIRNLLDKNSFETISLN